MSEYNIERELYKRQLIREYVKNGDIRTALVIQFLY